MTLGQRQRIKKFLLALPFYDGESKTDDQKSYVKLFVKRQLISYQHNLVEFQNYQLYVAKLPLTLLKALKKNEPVKLIRQADTNSQKDEFKFKKDKSILGKSKPYLLNADSSSYSKNTPHIAISFHIMTRAEPPTLVISTIKSLLNILKPQDEIIIVDNNHKQVALYQPIQKFCAKLAQNNVKFYHQDHIPGFKAGALNYALDKTSPHCNYIVVVDSDYHALPWARQSIVIAISNHPQHALIQFPQYYRNAGKAAVHAELNHYFSHHLRRPQNQTWALSTGTYAVLKKSALHKLGGWSGQSITEDAQMGVLMHCQGLSSVFIDQVIATGLLPETMTDLMAQRRRWIYGNMQVLLGYPQIVLPALTAIVKSVINYSLDNNGAAKPNKIAAIFNRLSVKITKDTVDEPNNCLQYIKAHLSQLNAWVNYTAPFIAIHVGIISYLIHTKVTGSRIHVFLQSKKAASLVCMFKPMPIPISKQKPKQLPNMVRALLTVCYGSYGVYLGRRLIAYINDSQSLLQASKLEQSTDQSTTQHNSINLRLSAWLMHMNFWELGALSWLPVLWGKDKPFICTPKLKQQTLSSNAFVPTILALPKLLILLNVSTAILVGRQAPVIKISALSMLALKLGAGAVAIYNFSSATKMRGVMPQYDDMHKAMFYPVDVATEPTAYLFKHPWKKHFKLGLSVDNTDIDQVA